MNRNKKLAINMLAAFVAYAVNLLISFFLSPYIVERVGVDAYGFIGLANNFINYVGLINIALLSMAGRFITIKLHENDNNGANTFFNSAFIANLVITAVMAIVFILIWLFLEYIVNVPEYIFFDVKLLFALIFLNGLITAAGSLFSVATFATNKLYLDSIRQLQANVLKIIILLTLFICLKPRVSYLGISTLACGLFVLGYNIYYTKTLLPQLCIKRKFYDFKAVLVLLSSGVWNLITRLGHILLDGLDLIISNIFINPTAMGILSLSKTIPSLITGIVGTLVNVFSPNFAILYAEKKMDELVASVKQSMKIMGVISCIPIIVLIVCGDLLYLLWQPTQDAQKLHVLSILACIGLIFNGGINCIYNIFTVVNKLRATSISVLITGIISAIMTFILLKTTDLSLYAVAGVSSIVATIRNLIFIVPYGAHCLNQKWYVFYSDVARPVVFVVVASLIGCFIKGLFKINGWIYLVILAMLVVIVSTLIGLFIVLTKNDRRILFKYFKRKCEKI